MNLHFTFLVLILAVIAIVAGLIHLILGVMP